MATHAFGLRFVPGLLLMAPQAPHTVPGSTSFDTLVLFIVVTVSAMLRITMHTTGMRCEARRCRSF